MLHKTHAFVEEKLTSYNNADYMNILNVAFQNTKRNIS